MFNFPLLLVFTMNPDLLYNFYVIIQTQLQLNLTANMNFHCMEKKQRLESSDQNKTYSQQYDCSQHLKHHFYVQ